jgi:hypothetical protein
MLKEETKTNALTDEEIENASGGSGFKKCPGEYFESAFPEKTCKFCTHFSHRSDSDGKHEILKCAFFDREERKSVDFWKLW